MKRTLSLKSLSLFQFSSLFILSLIIIFGKTTSTAQSASIKKEKKFLSTFPFSDPNPVPIPGDSGIYPYFRFTNLTDTAVQKEWTIITLENNSLALYILPEVGGKIYGAIDKSTGEEFIPMQKEIRFINKGKRGLWSPGGMEFNFGTDELSPSIATPVDYQLVENEDGSVSCWIGNLDLLSRKTWRVEIYLPPDKAWFETRLFWYYSDISFLGKYPVSVSYQFNEKDTSQTNLVLDPFEVKTLRISKQSKKGKWSIFDQSKPKTKVQDQQITIALIEILTWMKEKNYGKASIYVNQVLELQPENIYAIWVKAILYRLQGKQDSSLTTVKKILAIDPISHLAKTEIHLIENSPESYNTLVNMFQSEFPQQIFLENAIAYYHLGLYADAKTILSYGPSYVISKLWSAYLGFRSGDNRAYVGVAQTLRNDPDFVFPYRYETLPVLEWAYSQQSHWKTAYYLGLNYWALGQVEAAKLYFFGVGNDPDYAPFYIARGILTGKK